jgi:hypothetical protein
MKALLCKQYGPPETLVVEEVLPNSSGDQAGIQVGDRVLAINGRRVRGLGQWDLIRINFEVGKPYRLQVERAGKPFERVMTLQRRSWSQQTQYRHITFLLDTASTLLTLFVAFLVAFTRPYDWVARIGALSIALLGGFESWRQAPDKWLVEPSVRSAAQHAA